MEEGALTGSSKLQRSPGACQLPTREKGHKAPATTNQAGGIPDIMPHLWPAAPRARAFIMADRNLAPLPYCCLTDTVASYLDLPCGRPVGRGFQTRASRVKRRWKVRMGRWQDDNKPASPRFSACRQWQLPSVGGDAAVSASARSSFLGGFLSTRAQVDDGRWAARTF
jgi:hypothetical protein